VIGNSRDIDLPQEEKLRYSPTLAGYRAWLENGNVGNIEEFIEECGKASEKEMMMNEIMSELKNLSLEELKEVLSFTREY